MKKHKYKVGDLVRVLGRRAAGYYHCFKYGQVVEVVRTGTGPKGALTLRGTDPKTGQAISQWLGVAEVKPAKQAMRKREQYKNRR